MTDQEFARQQQQNAEQLLVGRTIERVEVVCSYGRIKKLIFWLDDTSDIHISHWAEYADDSSLEFGLGERD